MADAAGDEPHEHLARARLGELDLLDHQRLTELLEHRGPDPHVEDPSGRGTAPPRVAPDQQGQAAAQAIASTIAGR